MTNAIIGSVVAYLAAYLFIVLLDFSNPEVWTGSYKGSYSDLLIGFPLFVLMLNFWFILPIGGALSFAIPYVARKQTHKVAVFFALGIGALIGVTGGALGSYEMASVDAFSFSRGIDNAAWWASFWGSVRWLCPAMSLYLMAWGGTYAHLQAKQSYSKPYL